MVKAYGLSPARISFLVKDPRGFEEFNKMFSEHDAQGLSQHHARLPGRAAVALRFRGADSQDQGAGLIVVGDEDEPCLEPSFLLKQWIERRASWCCPRPAMS